MPYKRPSLIIIKHKNISVVDQTVGLETITRIKRFLSTFPYNVVTRRFFGILTSDFISVCCGHLIPVPISRTFIF
jgi:hypothetical protein